MEIVLQEIIEHYNLRDKEHELWIYIEIKMVVHGLLQADILANKQLLKKLAPHGYEPAK